MPLGYQRASKPSASERGPGKAQRLPECVLSISGQFPALSLRPSFVRSKHLYTYAFSPRCGSPPPCITNQASLMDHNEPLHHPTPKYHLHRLRQVPKRQTSHTLSLSIPPPPPSYVLSHPGPDHGPTLRRGDPRRLYVYIFLHSTIHTPQKGGPATQWAGLGWAFWATPG